MKLNVKSINDEAKKELAEENAKKAKEQLKGLYRKLEQAKAVVNNVEQEIADALASLNG